MNVDVILVCYNQRQFIRQAVESIIMQRVDSHVRVLVADDASNDDTLEIIHKAFEKSSSEVVFLPSEKNLGISKNYSRAFDACEGDYIAILEGDDYWSSPCHLQQHVDFLEEHRECSMSMNCFIFQEDETGLYRNGKWGYSKFPHYVNVREQIEQGNQLGNLSACVFRTSCIKNLPRELFDLSIADWMLGVMLSQQGFLAILEEPTSVYRTNLQSQWASKTKDEKMQIMLDRANEYDAFQKGKYHEYWQTFKSNLQFERKIPLKDYCPPFLISLMKACIPPVMKRFVKRRG